MDQEHRRATHEHQDTISGDTMGRPTSRSSFVGHPTRSAISRSGLWTVPELWKTHRTAFPTSSLDGAQNAPPTTVHKAFFFYGRRKNEEPLQ